MVCQKLTFSIFNFPDINIRNKMKPYVFQLIHSLGFILFYFGLKNILNLGDIEYPPSSARSWVPSPALQSLFLKSLNFGEMERGLNADTEPNPTMMCYFGKLIDLSLVWFPISNNKECCWGQGKAPCVELIQSMLKRVEPGVNDPSPTKSNTVPMEQYCLYRLIQLLIECTCDRGHMITCKGLMW